MNRTLQFLLKLVVTLTVLYVVYLKLDLRALQSVLRQAHLPWLAAGVLVVAGSKAMAALRLNRLFRSLPLILTDGVNLRLYWLGMFYNLFLPGSIGGDGYKIWLLRQRFRLPTARLFQAMILDRVSGLVANVVLVGVLAVFVPLFFWLRGLLMLAIPLAPLGYILGVRWLFRAFRSRVRSALLLAFGVQLGQIGGAGCVWLALGSPPELLAYLFLFQLSSIAAVIPFTVGGLGARELVFALGAEYLPMEVEPAVALSLLFYVLSMLAALPGGYFSLFPERMDLPPPITVPEEPAEPPPAVPPENPGQS